MRWLALLLVLPFPGIALGQDDIADLLRGERFRAAGLLAERRLMDDPKNKQLLEQRATAIRGQARDLQRADGYDAAIAFLEKDLTHWLLAEAYSETCLWAGREEHGIKILRSSDLRLAERIVPELRLLSQLRRYDEIVARTQEASRTVEWAALKEWEEFGGKESAMRMRLLGGAKRGRLAAISALVVILLGALALYRLAPKQPKQA